MNTETPISSNETNEIDSDATFEQMETALGQVWEIAHDFGMDPYPTNFELVPPHIMYEIGSYGLPDRFSHWTHGRVYRQMKTQYEYGISRLYEVVVNSDPSQAFLLETNDFVSNVLVMAHVLGHAEFFKHNYLFTGTRKDMPRIAHLHAERIHEYEEQYGEDAVEQFLDAVLSVGDHVDPFHPDRLPKDEQLRLWREEFKKRIDQEAPRLSEYDVLFGKKMQTPRGQEEHQRMHIPLDPDRDVLGFIQDYSPILEDWQRDIIDIIRDESLHFYPQRRTKIMNEGWAAFWHKNIMQEMGKRGYISEEDQWRWWKMHSSTARPDPAGLNPYFLGMKMFEYIIDYYNGDLTEEETELLKMEHIDVCSKFEGDLVASPGLREARRIMEEENDQSCIRTYFTPVAAARMNMYLYDTKETDGKIYYFIKSRSWEIIRDTIVAELANGGVPYIEVVESDYRGKGELFLKHAFEGKELAVEYTEKTLPYLYQLWGKSVHLETVLHDDSVIFSYDGKDFTYR